MALPSILLINGNRTEIPCLPTGLAFVAQAIENAGFAYEINDVMLQTDNEIVAHAVSMNPPYIGIGTMSYEVDLNYRLLEELKTALPEAKIILGGPHAIAAGHIIFSECPSIDIVIEGEAEETIIRVLSGEQLEKLSSVHVKEKRLISRRDQRTFPDIGTIAYPKYNQFDLTRYGDTMTIASSRGCPYKCSFCGAPKFLGKKWRAFSANRMFEEFIYWYDKGYRKFYFSDSLLVAKKQRIEEFCKKIVSGGYTDVSFTADGIRADNLTFSVLKAMRAAKFENLTIGVESVDDAVLTFYDKGQSFSEIDSALSMADQLGFKLSIYIIVGAPRESLESSRKSINYARKFKSVETVIISKLLPILGTPYYDYAAKNGILRNPGSYYPIIEVAGFNKRDDSHENVERIWIALQPEIARAMRFYAARASLRRSLGRFGLRINSLFLLNAAASIASNPLIFYLLKVLHNTSRRLILRKPVKTMLGFS